MTCDYVNREGIHCHHEENEAYEQEVLDVTGEKSITIQLCSEHKNRKISFERMKEIVIAFPDLYGTNGVLAFV